MVLSNTKMWQPVVWLSLVACAAVVGESAKYRLPTSVLPYHYGLRLLIDINPASNFSYYGIVQILVKCETGTDKITMHGKKFKVKEDSVKVSGVDDSYEVRSAGIVDDQLDLLTLQLDRPLTAGQNYTVVIPFFGNLEEDLNGAYISSFQNKLTGKKEYLVVTQFESIYARKTFPCFDEPDMKATFTMTLAHNKDYTAVSNMPLASTATRDASNDSWLWDEMMKSCECNDNSEGMVWDTFEKSVPMSTYLLAFVISKFSVKDSPAELSKTKFKIWARSDAIDQTQYASEIGPKVLSYYEEYFGIPFPLPKQDMFAIPDFASGAMENWGLITYRETALLYDSKESSLAAKQRVAEVIAHELAHQWFGNLVTMKWWSDLWLNEGFATYVETVGVHAVEPQWKWMESEAVNNVKNVFALDALNSSHPVSATIEDPNDISQIFDSISYSKGAVIIRMMVMFLTEDVFRTGIKNYLTKYSYKNAEQDDLWRSLTEAAEGRGVLPQGVGVKNIMDTWTKQTGYPLITVKRSGAEIAVTQQRYRAISTLSESPESWWVPLNMISQSNTKANKTEWLGSHQGVGSKYHQLQQTVNKDQWLLLNADLIGLYRINYDENNWKLLTEALETKYDSVPLMNRVQLLTDSFELAWNNIIDYNVPLKLVNYLHHETSYPAMDTGLGAFGNIDNVLRRTIDYGAFQKFMRKLVTKSYQNEGGLYTKKILNFDQSERVKMQVLTSSWACKVKVPTCEQNAISLFDEWMRVADPDVENPIPVELRGITYCVAMSRGSVEHWAFLFQRYQNANVPSAKTTMMAGLGCSREIWILKQYLEWTVDKGPEIRTQDAAAVIGYVARSQVGYYVAKPFVYERIRDLYRVFDGQSRRIGGILKSIVGQFTSQQELDEFLAWRSKNEQYLVQAKQSVDQAVENAQVNINWLKMNQKNVVSLMRKMAA